MIRRYERWNINDWVAFDKLETDKKYFVYEVRHKLDEIVAKTHGATMKHIVKKDFDATEIPYPTLKNQKEISYILDKTSYIIESRKQELQKLDNLIKSRFVEMFGDPLQCTQMWPIQRVGDVAESVDPQPSHRTPSVDENGVPYISIKDCNYVTGEINFDGARKVGVNVLEEHRSRYKLKEGDMIIGKIGTIGNPIFVPARNDYTLSANIVLIQPYTDRISPYFLRYSLMSDYVERQFDEAKNSTSQAAFGIQKVRTVKIMEPDISVQYEFESFARQTDKAKAVIQKSLDETRVLFDSLMQKYFG